MHIANKVPICIMHIQASISAVYYGNVRECGGSWTWIPGAVGVLRRIIAAPGYKANDVKAFVIYGTDDWSTAYRLVFREWVTLSKLRDAFP